MKTLTEIKQILQVQKPYLAEKYGVVEIGVFGSYVRGEQRPNSDVDILIELTDPPYISLIGLVNLENYLSDLLGVKVDVAVKKNLKRRIGQRILQEVIPL
jgi:predicted nucleotidyltransferase